MRYRSLTMCGFVGGILQHPVGEADVLAFRRASRTLVHRGPDEGGLVCVDEARAVLAFRRLSIIDRADGHQPMSTGSQHLVFNGEIYNYREVRERLRAAGESFLTASDTEVLLRALVRDGTDALEPLKGMFAFAFLDGARRRLLLARDRLGVKQLYYAETPAGFFFASEPKALLALPWMKAAFAADQLPAYFMFRAVPSPATLFAGISRLPAGHTLEYDLDSGRQSLHQYWALPEASRGKMGRRTLRQSLDQFEGLFSAAVRRRLVADVPVGAFLSGGIDSALIVAAMRRLDHPDIQTFTATFPGSPDDESQLARAVSRRFDTQHRERSSTAEDFLGALPRWTELNDDLVGDASSLPLLLVSDRARHAGCTVMLSGEGADEQFGGYGSYHKYVLLRAAARLVPSPAVREWMLRQWTAAGLVGAQDVPRVREYFVRTSGYLGTAALGGADGLRDLLDPGLHEALLSLPAAAGHSLAAAGRFDFRTRIPDDLLVRTDRATMGASIEARVPFLDHDLVEFTQRLPHRHRAVPGVSKVLPRLLARRWGVPLTTIAHRKIGFQLPIGSWFRGSLRGMWETVLRERAVPGLRYDAVRALHDAHLGGRAQQEELLWRVLALECWHRRWVRGELPDAHKEPTPVRTEAAELAAATT